jgi:hypothetical protein
MNVTLLAPAAVALTAAAFVGHSTGADDDVDDVAAVTTTTEPPELDWVHELDCEGLDSTSLTTYVLASGEIRFVYEDDGVITCDEVMVVTSYASRGPDVDNHHDPEVDELVFQVSELEAAGAAGITVAPELDECWAGLELHRDGDTLLWDHVLGDGCEMEVTTSFAGAPHPTEIHVVQQSGSIAPPYTFEHDTDDSTILTGLPNGTWYVKVYEGAVAGTTIAVDGGTPLLTDTIEGVPDGAIVDIAHPDPGRRVVAEPRLTAGR